MEDVPEPIESEIKPKTEEKLEGKDENTVLSPTENMEVEEAAVPEPAPERKSDDGPTTGIDSKRMIQEPGFKLPTIGPVKKRIPKPEREPISKEKIFPKPQIDSVTKSEIPESIPKEIKHEADSALVKSESDQEDRKSGIVKEEEYEEKTNDETKTKSEDPPKKLKHLSPAEQMKHSQQTIPYLEPKWGGRTDKEYYIEVLKGGKIITTIDLTEKSYFVFGRLPTCDVPMDHPSLSRFHAVLQYCAVPNDRHDVGWYLYDLESTHGTSINKLQVKPRVYYRVRVGHVLKFAGSTRLHILQGPDDDQEEESELTITEMKNQREQKKKEEELLEKIAGDEPEEKQEDTGCSWGMDDDAIDPEAENPTIEILPQNEELYLDDPKKTLKGFFEREGYDLPEYQFEEAGHGKHKCIVEVPVDSPTGQPVYAEAVVAGKRKDAVVACALEACRILDRYGLLRKKDHEAKKVKLRSWEENDYYSSDEDEFLDRTGEIEKKRQLRMKRAGKLVEKAETYESLTTKLTDVDTEIQTIEKQLEEAKRDAVTAPADDLDALDAYMTSIKKGALDTKTRMSLKRRLFDLRKDRGRLERLVNAARPALMPQTTSTSKSNTGSMLGKIGAMTRKIRGGTVIKRGPSAPPLPTPTPTPITSKEEVESDDSGSEGGSAALSDRLQGSPTPVPDRPPVEQRLTDPEPESTSVAGRSKQTKVESATSSTTDTPASTEEQTAGQNTERTDTPPKDEPVKPAPQKRHLEAKKTVPKKKKTVELSKDYCTDDPNYAVWVPPAGQTGDGKTHLNAKYGY